MGIFDRKQVALAESLAASEARAEHLHDVSAGLSAEVGILRESVYELELALNDPGWITLGMEMDRELSRQAIGQIAHNARLYYLKNPLINRAVEVCRLYIWAQGASVACADEKAQKAISEFMDDSANARAFTGMAARGDAEKELRVTGNFFLAFFEPQSDADFLRVRTVPLEEISDVVRNPQDRSERWFYKRQTCGVLDVATHAMTSPATTYHPDIDMPADSPARDIDEIDGNAVEWTVPLRHVKVGGFGDWAFGVSEVYSALDWARAHKDQLEAWSSVVMALKRFAWDMTTKGGAAGVASASTKFKTTVGADASETNAPPVAGAAFVHTEGNELKPIKTAGAAPSPEDTRYLLHMVCAGVGLAEFWFGNSDIGNYATSKVLDRPTEMIFLERQQLWRGVWLDVLLRACRAKGIEPAEEITFEFPDILEHSVDAAMAALVSGLTLDGKAPVTITDPREILRMVGRVLSIDDLDDLLDRLYPEGQPVASVVKGEEALAEALRDLSTRLTVLNEAAS